MTTLFTMITIIYNVAPNSCKHMLNVSKSLVNAYTVKVLMVVIV